MSVFTGIMGRYGGFGDGNGGNIALSIRETILRFLSTDHTLMYMTTALHPEVKGVGTVAYRKIQTLQNERYFGSNNPFQEPQADWVNINVDKMMVCKWKYETFNMARVKTASDLITQVAMTVYESMHLQLNAALMMFLKYHIFGVESTIKTKYPNLTDMPKAYGQFTKVKAFGQTQAEAGIADSSQYGDAVFQDYNTIRGGIMRMTQIYSKENFGINQKELINVISPIAQVSLSAMGRNQVGGTISNFQVENVSGSVLAGLKFFVDNMLDQNTPLGTSYNKDYNVNMKGIVGFLIHNEAVAMPINEIKAWEGTDPNDGNWYFGVKWMYGIGFLRPQLVWGYVVDGANVDVDNYFITGGNLGIEEVFDNTKPNGDWTVNRFAKNPNPNAYQQPAFVQTANPNADTTTTGSAQGKAVVSSRALEGEPEPATVKVGK